MSVIFHIHLDATDNHEVVWWSDSDGLPGFSATGATLRELRTLIEEAAGLYLPAGAEIGLELIAEPPSSVAEPAETPPMKAPTIYAPALRIVQPQAA